MGPKSQEAQRPEGVKHACMSQVLDVIEDGVYVLWKWQEVVHRDWDYRWKLRGNVLCYVWLLCVYMQRERLYRETVSDAIDWEGNLCILSIGSDLPPTHYSNKYLEVWRSLGAPQNHPPNTLPVGSSRYFGWFWMSRVPRFPATSGSFGPHRVVPLRISFGTCASHGANWKIRSANTLQLVVTNWQVLMYLRLPKSILLKHIDSLKLTWQEAKKKAPLPNHPFTGATVDGRNPAPVDMVNIPSCTRFYICQVVQDLFHQQYVGFGEGCISYGGLSPFPVFSLAVEGIASITCKTTDDFHQRCFFCSKVVTNPDSFAGFCRDI